MDLFDCKGTIGHLWLSASHWWVANGKFPPVMENQGFMCWRCGRYAERLSRRLL